MFWWHVYEKTKTGRARRIVIGDCTKTMGPSHSSSFSAHASKSGMRSGKAFSMAKTTIMTVISSTHESATLDACCSAVICFM